MKTKIFWGGYWLIQLVMWTWSLALSVMIGPWSFVEWTGFFTFSLWINFHGGVVAKTFYQCFTESYFHLEGYMTRYRVWSRKDRALRPYVTLHGLLRSDGARAQHNHPWAWYVSIILSTGYWEWTLQYDANGTYIGERCKWYGPGSIIFRRANHFHRLELPPSKMVWTLFITGPWCQVWTFMRDPANRIEIEHQDYPEGAFNETS